MYRRRRPFLSPKFPEDIGQVAVLLAYVPEIDSRIGDEVFLFAGPFVTLKADDTWLVSPDIERFAVVPAADLLLQVYGYDGVENLAPSPRPISPADMHESAVLLKDVPGTICRAGDMVILIEPDVITGNFWVERYITNDLVTVPETQLRLMEYMTPD